MDNLGIRNNINAVDRVCYDVAMEENLLLLQPAESTKRAYMNSIIKTIGELGNDERVQRLILDACTRRT